MNKYNEAGLRELFKRNFNCYADTDDESVVLAMDEDQFVRVVKWFFIDKMPTNTSPPIYHKQPAGKDGE